MLLWSTFLMRQFELLTELYDSVILIYGGGMSEWQGAGLENRCRRKLSGFESQSLRQNFLIVT